MERMPSIFNDVLSPVTPGPVLLQHLRPYRIARLARALLGEPPRRITVRMARLGGYYDTFYSMHSHEAILAALLGQELLRCDPEYHVPSGRRGWALLRLPICR